MKPKWKQHPAVNVTGDGSEVWSCKEQYCIETWNVRSMNQGKLEVVKQEMARVNIDILGIGELKWTGISEFNSDGHYIYYCGQESLRRNGVALNGLGWYLKNDRMISVRFKGKPLQYSCFENSMNSMKRQSNCTQVLHFGLFCWLWGLLHFF